MKHNNKKKGNIKECVALWSTSSGRGLPYDQYFPLCFGAYDLPTCSVFVVVCYCPCFICFTFPSRLELCFLFLTWLYSLNITWLSEIEHCEHKKKNDQKWKDKAKKDFGKCLLFFVGSLLESDLQVVCVWCFVVYSFRGVPLSVCLPCCRSTTPPHKKKEKQGVIWWFWLCCFVFFCGMTCNPQRSPHTPSQKTKNQKQARKGVELLLGPQKNRIKQNKTKNNTNPQQKWGRVTLHRLWCGHHPKPSKPLSPKSHKTKKHQKKVGGREEIEAVFPKWHWKENPVKRPKNLSTGTMNRTRDLTHLSVQNSSISRLSGKNLKNAIFKTTSVLQPQGHFWPEKPNVVKIWSFDKKQICKRPKNYSESTCAKSRRLRTLKRNCGHALARNRSQTHRFQAFRVPTPSESLEKEGGPRSPKMSFFKNPDFTSTFFQRWNLENANPNWHNQTGGFTNHGPLINSSRAAY